MRIVFVLGSLAAALAVSLYADTGSAIIFGLLLAGVTLLLVTH